MEYVFTELNLMLKPLVELNISINLTNTNSINKLIAYSFVKNVGDSNFISTSNFMCILFLITNTETYFSQYMYIYR